MWCATMATLTLHEVFRDKRIKNMKLVESTWNPLQENYLICFNKKEVDQFFEKMTFFACSSFVIDDRMIIGISTESVNLL